MNDSFFQLTIGFIRDVRNKYNIPKDKLTVYVDLYSKNIEDKDIELMYWEIVICKSNLGNLNKIEYCLHELFEKEVYFESTVIDGYNVFIALPGIDKTKAVNTYSLELSRLESQVIKYAAKINDHKFISNAPQEILQAEKRKLNTAQQRIEAIKSNILLLKCGKLYYDLLLQLGSSEKINWHIQYQRELDYTTPNKFEQQWFNSIYEPQINRSELIKLHNKICAIN